MPTKIILDDINGGYSLTKINANFQKIEDELNNNVLYRTNPGVEVNTMSQDLDMNGHDLMNVHTLQVSTNLSIGGIDLQAEIAKAQAEATKSATSATESAGSATASAGSATASEASKVDSGEHATTSSRWAKHTGTSVIDADTLIDSGEFSAKEYANGITAPTGSAKSWATKTDAEVVVGQGYGAKKYAQDAAASAASVNDANLVHKTGEKTLADIKTFTSSPLLPTPAVGDNTTKAATTAYVKAEIAADTGVVHRTGQEAINGLKSFQDGLITSHLNGGPLAGLRNKIINGNFDIWQRGTSQTTSGYGSDDRWTSGNVGSTKTHSQQVFTLGQTDVPGNPKFFSRTVVTSVAGAGNYVQKIQSVEDVSTLAGRTATLSFYAKADAAKTVAISFQQVFGTGGTPSANILDIGVTKVSLTTVWQKFTHVVNIPSMTGKTIGTNKDSRLDVAFWFDAGTDYNARTASLGHQSGTFDIAQVQLEEGSIATAFEQRPIGLELSLCQRYYLLIGQWGISNYSDGNTAWDRLLFPVEMRATPTLTENASDANINIGTFGIAKFTNGLQAEITPTTAGYVRSRRNNIALSAEL